MSNELTGFVQALAGASGGVNRAFRLRLEAELEKLRLAQRDKDREDEQQFRLEAEKRARKEREEIREAASIKQKEEALARGRKEVFQFTLQHPDLRHRIPPGATEVPVDVIEEAFRRNKAREDVKRLTALGTPEALEESINVQVESNLLSPEEDAQLIALMRGQIENAAVSQELSLLNQGFDVSEVELRTGRPASAVLRQAASLKRQREHQQLEAQIKREALSSAKAYRLRSGGEADILSVFLPNYTQADLDEFLSVPVPEDKKAVSDDEFRSWLTRASSEQAAFLREPTQQELSLQQRYPGIIDEASFVYQRARRTARIGNASKFKYHVETGTPIQADERLTEALIAEVIPSPNNPAPLLSLEDIDAQIQAIETQPEYYLDWGVQLFRYLPVLKEERERILSLRKSLNFHGTQDLSGATETTNSKLDPRFNINRQR